MFTLWLTSTQSCLHPLKPSNSNTSTAIPLWTLQSSLRNPRASRSYRPTHNYGALEITEPHHQKKIPFFPKKGSHNFRNGNPISLSFVICSHLPRFQQNGSQNSFPFVSEVQGELFRSQCSSGYLNLSLTSSVENFCIHGSVPLLKVVHMGLIGNGKMWNFSVSFCAVFFFPSYFICCKWITVYNSYLGVLAFIGF